MATYNDLLPDILPEVPGCPSTIAIQKLRDTVRHFCKESWYVVKPFQPITLLPYNGLAPDTYTYPVTTNDQEQVIGVSRLLYLGRELSSASENMLDSYQQGWRQQTGNQPRTFLVEGQNKVRLVPASDETQAIAVTGQAVVMPSFTATEFDDTLLTFADALSAGALARLQKMSNKEWSNMQAAQLNMQLYQDGLSLAKLEAMRGGETNPVLNPVTLA